MKPMSMPVPTPERDPREAVALEYVKGWHSYPPDLPPPLMDEVLSMLRDLDAADPLRQRDGEVERLREACREAAEWLELYHEHEGIPERESGNPRQFGCGPDCGDELRLIAKLRRAANPGDNDGEKGGDDA